MKRTKTIFVSLIVIILASVFVLGFAACGSVMSDEDVGTLAEVVDTTLEYDGSYKAMVSTWSTKTVENSSTTDGKTSVNSYSIVGADIGHAYSYDKESGEAYERDFIESGEGEDRDQQHLEKNKFGTSYDETKHEKEDVETYTVPDSSKSSATVQTIKSTSTYTESADSRKDTAKDDDDAKTEREIYVYDENVSTEKTSGEADYSVLSLGDILGDMFGMLKEQASALPDGFENAFAFGSFEDLASYKTMDQTEEFFTDALDSSLSFCGISAFDEETDDHPRFEQDFSGSKFTFDAEGRKKDDNRNGQDCTISMTIKFDKKTKLISSIEVDINVNEQTGNGTADQVETNYNVNMYWTLSYTYDSSYAEDFSERFA